MLLLQYAPFKDIKTRIRPISIDKFHVVAVHYMLKFLQTFDRECDLIFIRIVLTFVIGYGATLCHHLEYLISAELRGFFHIFDR